MQSDSVRQPREYASPLNDANDSPAMQPPLSHHSRTNSAISVSAGSDPRSGSSSPDRQRSFSSDSSGQIRASGDPYSSYGGDEEEAVEQLSPAPSQAKETSFKMGFRWGKEILRADNHREAKTIAQRVAVFDGVKHDEAMDGFREALKTDASAADDEATAAQQALYVAIASGQLPEAATYDRRTAVPQARGPRRTSKSQVTQERSFYAHGDEEGEIGADGPTGWGAADDGRVSVGRSVEYGGSGGSYSRHDSRSDGHGHTQHLPTQPMPEQQRKPQSYQQRQQQRQIWGQSPFDDSMPVYPDDQYERAPRRSDYIDHRQLQQQLVRPPGKWPQDSWEQPDPNRHRQQVAAPRRHPRQSSRVVTAAADPQLFEPELADESYMTDGHPHHSHYKGQKQYASSDHRQLAPRDGQEHQHKERSKAAGESGAARRARRRAASSPTVQHQGRGEQPRQLAPAAASTDQKLGMSLDAIGKKPATQQTTNTGKQSSKRSQDAAFVGHRQSGGGGGGGSTTPGQGSKSKRPKTAEYDSGKQHGDHAHQSRQQPLQGRQHTRGSSHRAAAQDSKNGSKRNRGGVKHREGGSGRSSHTNNSRGSQPGSNRGNGNNGDGKSSGGGGGGGGIAKSAALAGMSRVSAALYGALSGSKGGNSNVRGGSISAAGPKLPASGKHKAIEFSLGQK